MTVKALKYNDHSRYFTLFLKNYSKIEPFFKTEPSLYMSFFRDVTISYALHPPETEVSIVKIREDVVVTYVTYRKQTLQKEAFICSIHHWT